MPIPQDSLAFICIANLSHEANMFYQFPKFSSISQCPTVLNLVSDGWFCTNFNQDKAFIQSMSKTPRYIHLRN